MKAEEIMAYTPRYVEQFFNGELSESDLIQRLNFYKKRWNEGGRYEV